MQDPLVPVVIAAEQLQHQHGRGSDTPIKFYIQTRLENGEVKSVPIDGPGTPPLPEWYWPVLNKQASLLCLKNAISTFDGADMEALLLRAYSSDGEEIVVADLMDLGSSLSESSLLTLPVLSDAAVKSASMIIDNIAESANLGKLVIACSIEDVPDIDDSTDLSELISNKKLLEHQQYKMDGTGSVLYRGSIIDNSSSPHINDVISAIAREIARTGRMEEILILSGDQFDAGDGCAYLSNAKIISTVFP